MADKDTRGATAKQQFNVYLPPDLVRRAKHRALDEQLSLSDFVERVLELYLREGSRHDHDR